MATLDAPVADSVSAILATVSSETSTIKGDAPTSFDACSISAVVAVSVDAVAASQSGDAQETAACVDHVDESSLRSLAPAVSTAVAQTPALYYGHGSGASAAAASRLEDFSSRFVDFPSRASGGSSGQKADAEDTADAERLKRGRDDGRAAVAPEEGRSSTRRRVGGGAHYDDAVHASDDMDVQAAPRGTAVSAPEDPATGAVRARLSRMLDPITGKRITKAQPHPEDLAYESQRRQLEATMRAGERSFAVEVDRPRAIPWRVDRIPYRNGRPVPPRMTEEQTRQLPP